MPRTLLAPRTHFDLVYWPSPGAEQSAMRVSESFVQTVDTNCPCCGSVQAAMTEFDPGTELDPATHATRLYSDIPGLLHGTEIVSDVFVHAASTYCLSSGSLHCNIFASAPNPELDPRTHSRTVNCPALAAVHFAVCVLLPPLQIAVTNSPSIGCSHPATIELDPKVALDPATHALTNGCVVSVLWAHATTRVSDVFVHTASTNSPRLGSEHAAT
eukprot:c19578_g2_i2.p1 GENE.c19578_g2_i2~~c19578_g2_i2.p1  ORF type:complete len:215 (+),score=30.03 c19578_g2_i2:272-916(+)